MKRSIENLVANARRLGVRSPQILAALERVDRAAFLPASQRAAASEDVPLPIGDGQTTSQPSLIAYMLEKLQLAESAKVLEIGTGCGYQTALLAQLAAQVYSIERIPRLHEMAAANLADMATVHLRCGDGFLGWPEAAPFDAIILACAPLEMPPILLSQLAEGGRIVGPVGSDQQILRIGVRRDRQLHWQDDLAVRFVPMCSR